METTYNLLNLPRRVDVKNATAEARLEYIYSSSGEKLRVKKMWNPDHTALSDIGSGIDEQKLTKSKITDYIGNKIYEDSQLKSVLVEGGYYDVKEKKYYFYQKDHQENNRLVLDQSGIIRQKTDYYPFGESFSESTFVNVQPYKYNGKELESDFDLNLYDYHARWYDPVAAQFTSMDPLAEKYYSILPYTYVANNPVNAIDLRGDSIMILNLGYSLLSQHMGILIQNQDMKWEYFSVNGDNVFFPFSSSGSASGTFSGGRKFDDIAVGTFDSPQEFLDSPYNVQGDKKDKSINSYDYPEGFVIPTSSEQDEKIKETFVNIAEGESYRLNPFNPNHCGTTTQRAMESVGLKVWENSYNQTMGNNMIRLEARPYFPGNAFKTIMKNHPEGLHLKKNK